MTDIANRYKKLERLGKGAFGEVWMCHDVTQGGLVALKLLRETRLSYDRWQEAATLRNLNLPSVVRLLDEGMHHGQPFFVMSYIEGKPFPGHASAPEDILALGRRLLDVLTLLHRQGIIHGDLKPSNVLIDAQGQPHILDLGLARSRFGALQAKHAIYAQGSTRYMAPELLHAGAVDTYTDLYAVGVMLYEAACGRPPYRGRSLCGLAVERELRPRPRLAQSCKDAPEALVHMVDALLDPQPDRRKRALKPPGDLSDDEDDGLASLQARLDALYQGHATLNSPALLESLFCGPELGFHLPSRTARALYWRSAGQRAKLEEVLAQWRHNGLCTLDEREPGKHRIDQRALVALEHGWAPPVIREDSPALERFLAQPSDARDEAQHRMLQALALAQRRLDAATLAQILALPIEQVEQLGAALIAQEIIELGVDRLFVLPIQRLKPLLEPVTEPLRQLARDVRAALPDDDPRQTCLLELEERQEALIEATLNMAQLLDQRGYVNRATTLLERTLERLHAQRPDVADELSCLIASLRQKLRLLTTWATIALSTHTTAMLEDALRACHRCAAIARHDDDDPIAYTPESDQLQDLIELLELARLACRTPTRETLAALEEQPPLSDPVLELRRQMYLAQLMFSTSDDRLGVELERLEETILALDSQEALGTLRGWFGWRAYAQDDFQLAHQRHQEAAQLKQRQSAKLASALASLSALVELEGRQDEALAIAQRAQQTARALGHLGYELQSAYFIRYIAHLRDEREPQAEDMELLEAAQLASDRGITAWAQLNLGIKLLRLGERAQAMTYAQQAAQQWPPSSRTTMHLLSQVLLACTAGQIDRLEELRPQVEQLKSGHARQKALQLIDELERETPRA